MNEKKLYIHTIGCQMNAYDAGRLATCLEPEGYRLTPNLKAADLIVVVTCAIREKAEQKVYSFLGRLSELKKNKPGLVIAVGGCVAQQEGETIFQRAPYVDIVFGTDAVHRFPQMVRRIESGADRHFDIGMFETIEASGCITVSPVEKNICRYITIMQGCDNFCTYCVVPYVRGREKSRAPEDIVSEIKELVKIGVKEIMLIGQNVNSYGQKEDLCSFPELLARANEIDGIERIRFTTSHPKDLSGELIDAYRRLNKLCHHIHLPVQSGSDRILHRMNRKYNISEYIKKVEALKNACPDIGISSDLIVGFPGETDADFEDTIDLINQIKYDSIFAFKYSDRPNAPARRFSEKIAEDVKQERLARLLKVQESITLENYRLSEGTIQKILVEGVSRKHAKRIKNGEPEAIQWSGRTSTNRIVNFSDGDRLKGDLAGQILDVKIEKAYSHSLWGRLVHSASTTKRVKGEDSYAA